MLKRAAAKTALVLGSAIVALCLVLPASPSQARVFVGVGVGVPLFVPGPWYYPPPYYPPAVYAPPVYAPVVQPTYVAPPAQSWYYCDNPKGYYPYVNSCSTGWRPVPAKP